MAIRQAFETQQTMDLSEFVEYVEQKVDMTDQEALLALGEQLTMLGNNRRLLTDFMAEYIKKHLDSGDVEGTISQGVTMIRTKKFYIRFAFWLPEHSLKSREYQLYAYNQAHDHNFDLLSYAYCGSGYETDIFEYDYDTVTGYLGERVAIRPLGRHQHGIGDVLLYRCSKDIHFQFPPATPSITLNVIPLNNEHGLINQYFFQIENPQSEFGMLSGHVDSNMEFRNSLYNIAKHFPSPKLSRVLAETVDHYPCQRSRYEALRALAECDASAHRLLCEKHAHTDSRILRHHIVSECGMSPVAHQ